MEFTNELYAKIGDGDVNGEVAFHLDHGLHAVLGDGTGSVELLADHEGVTFDVHRDHEELFFLHQVGKKSSMRCGNGMVAMEIADHEVLCISSGEIFTVAVSGPHIHGSLRAEKGRMVLSVYLVQTERSFVVTKNGEIDIYVDGLKVYSTNDMKVEEVSLDEIGELHAQYDGAFERQLEEGCSRSAAHSLVPQEVHDACRLLVQ